MRSLTTKQSVFYNEMWYDSKYYKDDFQEVIRQREKTRIPFLHQSPQFAYRCHLVEYIKRLCIEKKLTHCCLHLAVYLLDIFMDNHSIVPERLLIVANVCLLLAGKLEENTTTTPKIVELNSAINNRYPIKDYKELEALILKFFDWYIMFPTAAHYVHYYIQAIISKDDLKENHDVRTLFYNLHDHVTTYLDQIIDNVHYMQCYPPSKLAAAIIAASRMDMELTTWSESLENLTKYSRDEIQEPLKVLLLKETFYVSCSKCQSVSKNTEN